MIDRKIQLSRLVDVTTQRKLIVEVKRIFSLQYPEKYFSKINKSYLLVNKLFDGKFNGYKECNTFYHDQSHTLDAFLAVMRLIDGYNLARKNLPLENSMNLLIATLLHDTGYIQEDWDNDGTGAKYTKNHVERSVLFINNHYKTFNLTQADADDISTIIKCTGLNVNMNSMSFISKNEKIAGSILGTADLLSQMADRIYLEKLIFLYNEFKEAGILGFNTEFDIVRKTVDFYEETMNRFDKTFMGIYKYARYHFKERFKINSNLYMISINRHISYLKMIIDDDKTNFRHKLKRFNEIHSA
jgi:hypothetical protein